MSMTDKGNIDTGTGALFRSLGLSFAILRVLIMCLLVAFVFSGSFTVRENEQAVILRFGKLVGDPGAQLIESGRWHWAWPEPIDKVVRIPVKKSLRVSSSSFWFAEEMVAQDSYASDLAQLVAGRDGYLLTGDTNIIHLKTAAVCRIVDPIKYEFSFETVGKERFLKNLMNNAVQSVLASWQVDDALYRNVEQLENQLQLAFATRLAKSDLGIEVGDFIVESKTAPRAVVSAFTNVLETELRKDTQINEARALAEVMMTDARGKAAKIIADASLYKTRTVSSLNADAEYFKAILRQYEENRQATILPLYSSVLGKVLANAGEKFILPVRDGKNSELRLRLSREPE